MFEDTRIVVLAGGKGTRMLADLPKVLVSVLGQPMINHVLDTLETLDLAYKPVAIVGYAADQVRSVIGDRAEYALQEEQLGTGHAVECAINVLDQQPVDQVVIFGGDQPFLSADTITKLVEVQRENSGPLSLATIKVDDPEEFQNQFYALGRVVRDTDGNLQEIVELKDATPEQRAITEINPQFWCIDYPWLRENITKVQNNNAKQEYYLTDLLKIAVEQGGPIGSVITPTTKEAYGINSNEQLEEIERRFGE